MARGTWGGLTDPNIFRVRIAFKLGQSSCQTGFHLRDVGIQNKTVQDVNEAVQPWADTKFRTILGAADSLLGVDVVKLGTDEGFSFSFTTTAGTYAIGAGDHEPGFVSACIALKSEVRRRYGQGRMMWPLVGKGMLNDDAISTAGRTALNGVLNDLLDRFTGSAITTDLQLVNAHGQLAARAATPSSPARPVIPPSWYDVTTARINTTATILRSRKVNVGS